MGLTQKKAVFTHILFEVWLTVVSLVGNNNY